MRAPSITFAALLQDFFLLRLGTQRGASARTIASYRDTFEILLRFAERHTGQPASALTLHDLDAPFVLDFLDHIEKERRNSPRTRNVRLAPIRSFMRYASVRDPASLVVAQRVLDIPAKRFDRPLVGFLTREEVGAVLDAPDRSTWSGRRDAVLLATLYNTGARVSEITGLRVANVLLDRESAVHLHGKGRKERVVPLWKSTADNSSGTGSRRSFAAPTIRCSLIAPGGRSRGPGWRIGSSSPSGRPSNVVRPSVSVAGASHPTPCGTRQRCISSSPASPSPSSRSGSATRVRRRPTATSKPTSP